MSNGPHGIEGSVRLGYLPGYDAKSKRLKHYKKA
jgi:hypothetical protein